METLRDLVRLVVRERVRMLLTLMGIAIGSGAVVFLASTLHGARYTLQAANQDSSGPGVTRAEARRAPPQTGRGAPGLSDLDVDALARHEGLPPDRAVGSMSLYEREAFALGRAKKVGVQSGGTPYARMAGLTLAHGRWPDAAEDGARVCVIGWDVWRDLYVSKWPLPIDGILLDGAVRLSVVGVLRSKPPMGGGDGDGTWMVDRRIFVSNATFVREIEPAATYDEISLWSRTSPASGAPDVKAIAGRLSPLLVNLHHGVKDFEFDALARGADIEGLIDVALTVALLGCGLVASLVGAVNVMNAQLVAVAERTRELGIRRALGASSRRLRASVLLETILLAGVASVLGTTVGVALAKGASALLTAIVTPWPFEIVGWAVWVAVGGAVASGALAGWLPAERAASLDVAACLRAS